MIIIKDKEKRSQIMIPRSSNISGVDVAEYITKEEFLNYEFATVDYVNDKIEEVVGDINNTLEDIIN